MRRSWLAALIIGVALLLANIAPTFAQGIEGGDLPFFCFPGVNGQLICL